MRRCRKHPASVIVGMSAPFRIAGLFRSCGESTLPVHIRIVAHCNRRPLLIIPPAAPIKKTGDLSPVS